jgi:hypothetical protein
MVTTWVAVAVAARVEAALLFYLVLEAREALVFKF